MEDPLLSSSVGMGIRKLWLESLWQVNDAVESLVRLGLLLRLLEDEASISLVLLPVVPLLLVVVAVVEGIPMVSMNDNYNDNDNQ